MKYTDDRGTIEHLDDFLQVIYSKPLSRRAGHYHLSSGHRLVLTRGSLDYFERKVGVNEKPSKTTFVAPCYFDTGPLLEHLMVFREDSDMVCLRTGGSKNQEDYEKDLVRIPWDLEKIYKNWKD